MSTKAKGSGGTDLDASGDNQNLSEIDGEKNPKDDGSEDSKTYPAEFVQRLLKEKKDLKAKLDKEESEKKAKAEAELAKNQEWQKAYETSKNRIAELEAENNGIKSHITDSQKLSSFMSKLSGTVDAEYWNLIDLEQVDLDPVTGKVDESSALRAAKEFEKKHSRLIDKPNGAKLPADAAKGAAAKLTYDQWLNLPLAEQKKRYKEVYSAEQN